MSGAELLALVKDTPGALQSVAVAPPAVPSLLPPTEHVQSQFPAPVAAAFDNRLGTLPGQHGVPFIGKKRSGEEVPATNDQSAVEAPPTRKLAAPTSTGTITNQSHEQQAAPSCLLYTSPSPRDLSTSRMPSSA